MIDEYGENYGKAKTIIQNLNEYLSIKKSKAKGIYDGREELSWASLKECFLFYGHAY